MFSNNFQFFKINKKLIFFKINIFKVNLYNYIYIMSTVITPRDFNATNISATKPKLNKYKRLQSLLLYSKDSGTSKSPLYIETPEGIISQFGLSRYEKGNTGTFDYSLPMTARSSLQSEADAIENFFEQLRGLDNFMIDYGVQFSKQIFGKEYTEEQRGIVEAMYSPCVRQKKDDEGNMYPPNISPKISKVYVENRQGDGTPDIEVYMGSESPLTVNGWQSLMDILPKRTPITAIMQPRIWFVSGRFGITLRVLQLKVLSVSKSGPPRGYSFSKPPAKLENKSTEQHEETTHVENSEELEETEVVESGDDDDQSEEIEDSDSEEEIEEVST